MIGLNANSQVVEEGKYIPVIKTQEIYQEMDVEDIDYAIAEFVEYLKINLDSSYKKICVWDYNVDIKSDSLKRRVRNKVEKLDEALDADRSRFDFINQHQLSNFRKENKKLNQDKEEDEIKRRLLKARIEKELVITEYQNGAIDIDRYLKKNSKLIAEIKELEKLLELTKGVDCNEIKQIAQKNGIKTFIIVKVWDNSNSNEEELIMRITVLDEECRRRQSPKGKLLNITFAIREIRELSRPGFFKIIINFLFEGKLTRKYRKIYKSVLKNGSFEELGNIIPRSGRNGVESPQETAFLKYRPTTYYMTMGIFRESVASNRSDSTFVGECFCTANEILKNGLNTDEEFRLLKKIDAYNKKNDDPLGILEAGGRQKYLRKKCNEYKKYLKDEVESSEISKEILLAKRKHFEEMINNLELQTIGKREKIDQLLNDFNENQITIQTTEQEWEGENYEISYSIAKTFEGLVNQQCLNRTVQKLINVEPLTDDCEAIFAQHIIVERKRNQDKEINAFRRAQASGYSLGEYCDNGIKNSTKIYLTPLLNDIRKVPSDYRSMLVVNLQITGNADASPCNGGCNFTGLEDMVYSYKNTQGEIKSFSTKKGIRRKINNEQLAFARAICAQYEAKELLNNEGVTDIKFEFVVNIADTKGESSRGVKIAFELENQFLHYQDKIEELTQVELQLKKDLDNKKGEMNEIEEKLAEKGEELREINEEILIVEENLLQIKQDLIEIDSSGLRKNLIKILRARGMSRDEAIKFLEDDQ